jgi:hypothetical protein
MSMEDLTGKMLDVKIETTSDTPQVNPETTSTKQDYDKPVIKVKVPICNSKAAESDNNKK